MYELPPFFFAARTPNGVVLLDLKGNRYLGIARQDDALLAQVVRDWPAFPLEQNPGVHTERPAAQRLASKCVASGLLIDQSKRTDPLPSIPVSLNQELVSIGDELRPCIRITLGYVFNFVIACAAASLTLRLRKLLVTAQEVRSTRDKQRVSFDCDIASRHVAAFRRLRPYLFNARGRCLFHSLALIFFLRRYGVFPTWVIGVRTDPWEAHSWIQEGPYLLDTNPEQVCEFTPILGI